MSPHETQRPGKPAAKPQMQSEPKPPFPEQHQVAPGLESQLDPKPRYQAARYRPAGKLEGRVALITGGDSGIGRAVAVRYAREGADVAIGYLPEEDDDAQRTRESVEREGTRCLLIPGATKALCMQLIERGIAGLPAEKVAKFGTQSPMGRPAQPEEVAPAYVFLADADSSFITGIVLQVMGGETTSG